MYQISEYSNKIKHVPTGEVFIQDDRNERYLTYLVWLKQNNTPEKVAFLEGEEEEKKQKLAIEIDLEYTEKIGKILTKHQNKKTRAEQQGQIYIIPQITISEVAVLEQECNRRILEETGIATYTYRQSNPILAKGITI